MLKKNSAQCGRVAERPHAGCGKACDLFDAMDRTILMLTLVMLQVLLVLPLSAAVIADDTGNPSSLSKSDPLLTTECEVYNSTSCLADGTDCSGTDHCNLHSNYKYARCYVAWTNTSQGKVDVSLKGCIYGDQVCQGETKCIAKHEYNMVTEKMPLIYCCCHTNNCNREFSRESEPEPIHKRAGDNSSSLGTILLCTGSLCVLVVIVVLIFYFYRKSKMPPYFHPLAGGASDCTSASSGGMCISGGNVPESVSQHTAVSTLCPPQHRSVQLLEVKAKGRFGALWMAKCNEQHVAVKIFPASDYDSWNVEKEVYGLPQFRHVNILEFIGAEKHGDSIQAEYWLISAYHHMGSLSDYLKANLVSWSEVARIASSMAQGLCYLHEELPANGGEAAKPTIAHRDFKSKNVLLKADLTACVADFGLAIVFYQGQPPRDAHGQVGTRRYMAPEVLEGAISFQADAFLRIDMYACGLVLWELVSRCAAQDGPVPEYKLPFEDEVGYHPTLDDMQECVVVQKCRPSIRPHWLQHNGLEVMVSTMEECWDHDSEARLTAACVVERLSNRSLQNVANNNGGQPLSPKQSFAVTANNAANTARTAAYSSVAQNMNGVIGSANQHHTPPNNIGSTCARSIIPAGNISATQDTTSSNIMAGNNMAPRNGYSNILPSINLHHASLQYPNGSTSSSADSKYGSYLSSSSSSSGSGNNGGFVNHYSALSNQIPRPVVSSKQALLPTVNVPLPQFNSGTSLTRLPAITVLQSGANVSPAPKQCPQQEHESAATPSSLSHVTKHSPAKQLPQLQPSRAPI